MKPPPGGAIQAENTQKLQDSVTDLKMMNPHFAIRKDKVCQRHCLKRDLQKDKCQRHVFRAG